MKHPTACIIEPHKKMSYEIYFFFPTISGQGAPSFRNRFRQKKVNLNASIVACVSRGRMCQFFKRNVKNTALKVDAWKLYSEEMRSRSNSRRAHTCMVCHLEEMLIHSIWGAKPVRFVQKSRETKHILLSGNFYAWSNLCCTLLDRKNKWSRKIACCRSPPRLPHETSPNKGMPEGDDQRYPGMPLARPFLILLALWYTGVVVVVLTWARIFKFVITGDSPVTLEWRNTTQGKKHTISRDVATAATYTVKDKASMTPG